MATAAALLIGGIGGLVVGITDEQSLSIVAPVTESRRYSRPDEPDRSRPFTTRPSSSVTFVPAVM